MSMDLQRLAGLMRQCITQYDMIAPGEGVAVGLSGGKDSLALLMGLAALRQYLPVPFRLCAIHVDVGAGMPQERIDAMAEFCRNLDVPFHPVIAYGHHKDDFIETSLMNLFLEGRYECFPPVTALDRTGLRVIRPMLFVDERDLIGFARREQLPVAKNPCPADGQTRREDMKDFLRRTRTDFPDVRNILLP